MPILIGLIVIVIVICTTQHEKREKKMDAKVEELSPKIKALKELNEKVTFHKINDVHKISQYYDNKWQFNKIEPAYLLSAELRDKIDSYAKLIQIIKENRQIKVIYDKRVSEILNIEYDIDYKKIGISEQSFKEREARLFNNLLVPQYVDCTISVYMMYSSPKGRVRLNKSEKYNFDQLVASFNSVSRSRLDYQTYQELAAVERGKVSNSLRYDIMRRDGFRCQLCGASAKEGVTLHVDHIIPIAKGGKSTPDNLRTLCERCNVGKSDKLE